MASKVLRITGIFILVLLILILFNIRPDRSVEWIKAKYADNSSKYVQIMDMEVHYKDSGKGTPLVLLHGTGASLHTWDGWTQTMAKNLRVIRLDLPGFGITGPFPSADYSIDHYVRFLDAFTSTLGLDTFYLAGNSLGGNIAWNYALTHPGKVKKLCLLNAAGYPSETSSGVFTLARSRILAPVFKLLSPRFLIEKTLKEVYHDNSRISDTLIDRYWNMARRTGNRQAFIDRVRTKYQPQHFNIVDIRQPTLILWGEHDSWISVDNARRFHQDIDDSELIIYPGLGHVIMEEDPEKTAGDALQFFMNQQ